MNQILAVQCEKLLQGFSGLANSVIMIRRVISVPGRAVYKHLGIRPPDEARHAAQTGGYLPEAECSVRIAEHLPLETGLHEVGSADAQRAAIDHEVPLETAGLSSGTFPPRMWHASAALKFCRLPFGLAVAKSMLSGVREVLCATRRSRLLLGVAIAVFPLMVILILLEISYKNEVAREDSLAVTNTLAGSPAVDPAELKFEAEPPQLQLGRPIVPFGPPIQPAAADASPPEPPQKPPQNSVVARKPVPLPRSRPNRF